MKRVIIGEKCIGCGICLHNKKYIEETTDGIARAIPGMMVTDKDLPDLEEIERICPIHELHLSPLKRETADSRVLSESKERLLEEMRDFRDHFKLKRPEFHPDPGYDITDLPLDYDYPEETFSSWDDADEALRKCFKNHVYDEDIRSMMTRQILARYKAERLSPYYLPADNPWSYFYEYNKEAQDLLGAVYARWDAVSPDESDPPESWKEILVSPSADETCFSDFETSAWGMDDLEETVEDSVRSSSDEPYSPAYEIKELKEDTGFFRSNGAYVIDQYKALVDEYGKDLIQGINEGISKDIKFDDMFKKVFDTYERDMKHAIDEKIKELEKK